MSTNGPYGRKAAVWSVSFLPAMLLLRPARLLVLALLLLAILQAHPSEAAAILRRGFALRD